MNLYLVSDIFGRTPALQAICNTLSKSLPNVKSIQIIDPYNGIQHGFATQDIAYQYFMNNAGLGKYSSILKETLKIEGQNIEPATILIGFSVGASVIWEISGQKSFRHISKAFCFYGSQIRNKKDISPLFDIELIFPKSEPHFDVDDLITFLDTKNHVACKKANGLHGFMNKVSHNFDQKCYSRYLDYLTHINQNT